MAIYQGLKTAGKETQMDFLGVYVMQVADDSTFKGILNIADTVTGVNGKTFKSSKELIDYCCSQKIGDPVSVTILRMDKPRPQTERSSNCPTGKTESGLADRPD